MFSRANQSPNRQNVDLGMKVWINEFIPKSTKCRFGDEFVFVNPGLKAGDYYGDLGGASHPSQMSIFEIPGP